MKNTNSTQMTQIIQMHTDLLSGKLKSLFENSEKSSRNLKPLDFQLSWSHYLKLARIIRVNPLNPQNPCCYYLCKSIKSVSSAFQKNKVK